MEFRSTNDNGYNHYQGDIISNVSSGQAINSSHGVHLTGGSTGGIVLSAGDESNIPLNLRAKGTAGLRFGVNSTSQIPLIQMYRIDWTIGALSSAGIDAASADSTITVAGATTNSVYVVQRRGALNSTNSTGLFIEACCSTAAEIRLRTYNIGASTISGSTMSAYLLQVQFNPS